MDHTQQVTMIVHDHLVRSNHPYRKILAMLDFTKLCRSIQRYNKEIEANRGYGIKTLFKCILLQFMENLSDRELERFLQENNAAKYFCGFSLEEKTPHFTLFSKVRERIGTNRLSKLFSKVRDGFKRQGYLPEIFTFIDASHLISKNTLWKERDEAIAKKYEKLNNEVLPKVAVDKQARIGCKKKNKYWYGYKKHVSVDMQTGLINKVAVTPANITDAQGLSHVCPSQGAVHGDKGYCMSPATREIARRGCHDATIKRNNMKGKNKDKDRWFSHLRSPYERVFSKQQRRVRYRGVCKNQFSEFFNALCFNIKRLMVLSGGNAPPVFQVF